MSADGTWNVTINTPMGAQQGTLTLRTSGDGLEGKLESPQGTEEPADGKIDGDALMWSVSITQPMPMKLDFTAKVDGDQISGDVVLGSFGKATFSGSRA